MLKGISDLAQAGWDSGKQNPKIAAAVTALVGGLTLVAFCIKKTQNATAIPSNANEGVQQLNDSELETPRTDPKETSDTPSISSNCSDEDVLSQLRASNPANDIVRPLIDKMTQTLTSLGLIIPTRLLQKNLDYIIYDAMQGTREKEELESPIIALGLYPRVSTMLEIEKDNFIRNIQLINTRVCADLAAGNFEGLIGDGHHQLTKIEMTNSDPHNGQQRVAILTFDNNKKVVYKPRDIKIDNLLFGANNSFAKYVSTLGGLEGNEQIPTHYMIPLQDEQGFYGYTEYLSYSLGDKGQEDYVFQTKKETQAYFRQIGRLHAIATLLGVSDLHQGNLIVHEKRPFLTDLEITFAKDSSGQLTMDTGLNDALTKFGDPMLLTAHARHNYRSRTASQRPGSDLTNNWVYSVADRKGLKDGLAKEYANSIEEGFYQVVHIFNKQSDNILKFLRETVLNAHPTVRNLPKGTESFRGDLYQLATDKNCLKENYETFDQQFSVGLSSKYAKKSPEMLGSLKKGDIPYFTKILSEAATVMPLIEQRLQSITQNSDHYLSFLTKELPDVVHPDTPKGEPVFKTDQWISQITEVIQRKYPS